MLIVAIKAGFAVDFEASLISRFRTVNPLGWNHLIRLQMITAQNPAPKTACSMQC